MCTLKDREPSLMSIAVVDVPCRTPIRSTLITVPTTRGNLDQDSIGSTTGDWLLSTDFISAEASSSVGRRRLIFNFLHS